VAAAKVGDPTEGVLMGPMLDAKFAERYEQFLDWIEPHHKPQAAIGRISAANPRDGFVGDPAPGLFYHPVVVDGVRPGDRLFMEETFGPIIGIATYRTLDEAIELANAPGYGLSSSIYTTDPKDAFTFRDRSVPAWCRSTIPPPGQRRTCRSVATASPATDPGSPGSGCSISSPAGSRSTGTTRAAAEGPDGHSSIDPDTTFRL
jgi:hypothetical protein